MFLRDHGRKDSYVYGDILDIRVNSHVQLLVEMTREEEYSAWSDGIMSEFSPGFDPNWLDPHTGNHIGPTLMELSYTSMGYQRNLRKPGTDAQVALSRTLLTDGTVSATGETMATKKELMAEEETMLAAGEDAPTGVTLDELAAKLDKLIELMTPKELSEDEEEKVEMMDEDEEKKELQRRVKSLEDERTVSQLSAAGITGDVVAGLVKLRRVDADLFGATVRRLSAKQSEIGVGNIPTSSGNALVDVAKAARHAGADKPGRLPVFLSQNFPEFAERAQDVRNAIRNL